MFKIKNKKSKNKKFTPDVMIYEENPYIKYLDKYHIKIKKKNKKNKGD